MKMERKYSHIVTFLNKVCCYHLQDDKENNVYLALDVYSVDSKASTLLQMKELFCLHPITKRDADCKEVTIIHTSMQYHNGLGCCVPITVILKYFYSKKNILFLFTTQIQQGKLILNPLGKLDCCCNDSSCFCISAGPSLAFLEERQLVLVLPFFKTKKHITLPVTNTDKILYFQNDENFTYAECVLSSTNRLFRINLEELSFDSTEIFFPYYIGTNTFVNLEKVQNNIEVIINCSEGRLLKFCNGSMVNLSRATFSDVESISFLKYSTFCYLVLCTLHHKVYLLNRETLQIERSWQHVWLTVIGSFSENGRQKLLLIPLSEEQNKIILIDTQDLINEKNLKGKSLNFQNSINHHSTLDALLFRMKEGLVILDKVFSEVERKKNFTMGLINRFQCFSKAQDFSELSQDKLVSVLPSSKHHNHQENHNSLDLVDLWQKIYGKTWSIVVIVKNVTTKPVYNITLSLSTSKAISYETKWIIEDMKEYYGEEKTLGSSSARCLLSGSAVVLGLLVRTKPAMNQCINYSNCYLTVSFTSDESESFSNIDESLSSFKTQRKLIQMLIGKITLNAKDIIDDRPSFCEGLITKFHKQIKSRQVMYKGVNVEDFKDKISLILTTDQQNLLFNCFDKKSLTTECLLRNYLGATLLSNIQFFSWKNNCLQFNDNVWLEICGSAHLSSGTVTIHYRSESDLIILYHYLYKHLPSFILMEAERRHFHLKRGLSQELHYIKKLLDISSDNAENLSEYLDKLREECNAKRLKFFHSADLIVSSSQYKKHLAMLFHRQTETDKFVSTRNK